MHQTATEQESHARNLRITIFDADPVVREGLSDTVHALGHTVCHAAGPGRSALEAFTTTRPDLALIGLDTGEAAGVAFEMAEWIAAHSDAPIVYATETTDGALLERAERTNPHGYVLKSADPRQLGLTIRAALGMAARERGRPPMDREEPGREALWKSTVLADLFDHLSDAVVVADASGRFVAVNAAARKLSETYDPSNPEGWFRHFDVYDADGRTPADPDSLPLTRALRGKGTENTVIRLRPRYAEAGTADLRLAVSGYPLHDSGGKNMGGAVVLRNAPEASENETRARRAEAELHERLQVLDAIISSMSDGVVVADDRARLTLFNPSAERMLGLGLTDRPPAEWTGHYGIFHVDRSTPVPERELPVVRAVRGETTKDMHLFIRNPQLPEGVYISVNASPVRDKARRVVGGVAVFRDITEHRMEREALTQAFAHGRLEVIDTVLHNIGNAINSIATGSDTLHDWFANNDLLRGLDVLAEAVDAHEHDWPSWLAHDEQGRQLRPVLLALIQELASERKRLGKTAARVCNRVRHVVDIIRTQATFTDGTVERKQVELKQVLHDAATIVRESAGRGCGEIQIDCSRAPMQILIEENRLQQMLVNLIKNAVEATDERREKLDNDPGWQPGIRVVAYGTADNLTIDVIDNGIGKDPTQAADVFKAGHTTKSTGSGLGLHSAANFVIGSGGNIHLISAGIGRGATLRVTLRTPTRAPAGTEAAGETGA